MAITGTGTQADPYIVHNYTELKSACRGNGVYVNLSNDIDCNDYGENFEWEAIQGSGDYQAYFLDLQWHTIKNFKVKENDYAFKLTGTSGWIKNGKILNCYLKDTLGFCCRTSNNGTLENLSISTSIGDGLADGTNRYVFNEYCFVKNCAIYVEGSIPSTCVLSAIFHPSSAANPYENTDILLNINNSYGMVSHANNSYEKVYKKCRIRGTFNVANNYGENSLFDAGFDNSVIDLLSNFRGDHLSSYASNSTGVINSDKLPISDLSGMTAVTSAEIINGDALRAKGFEVINVVE